MNTLYESTRSSQIKTTASKAVLKGLAPDGGLFVMRDLDERKVDVAELSKLSYVEMAKKVLGILLPDYPEEVMSKCVEDAYVSRFDTDEVTPVAYAGDSIILELFHGPTCAFKDVALQMLPRLVTASKKLNDDKSRTVILTATSGDTGKAALEGFKDVEGTSIIVFFPNDGVSVAQKAQMTTQEGNNTYVCGINGDFDDTQTGVKKIFSDNAISNKLLAENMDFSSANSINVGRLAPQVVYYFYAYKKLLEDGKINFGDKINFAVPTGNFGDILAGRYAKMLGLPINKLICASNENNVLFDFIRTGNYNRKRELAKTISPSMDILVSSNLERLLYYVSGKDNALVADLMNKLSTVGEYTIPEFMRETIDSEFWAGYADGEATMQTIREFYESTGYVSDTHTAVALNVVDQYKSATGDATPTVVLSTASPYKFSNSVYTAIFGKEEAAELEDEFAVMDALCDKTGVPVPSPLKGLKNKPVLHKTVKNKDQMADFVLETLGIN